ncbi:hypothetical protein K435DRAFT_796580 [Dendrothele bispora CBS 962.96]|uniref:Uncharacterized protein n=1 Tax=Dendrothele bispora (strain CBS 962.96) TaxID=1314807 RepID=A0A4S8M5U4_DENBC|nr:hypothetical protein K435DRAFT_796580 [Dendrothele bispora CBS 962.96]
MKTSLLELHLVQNFLPVTTRLPPDAVILLQKVPSGDLATFKTPAKQAISVANGQGYFCKSITASAAMSEVMALLAQNQQFMLALFAQQQAQAAQKTPEEPKAPEFPVFTSNPVPPSKSLLDLFPSVPQNTLLDIAWHNFLPFDLRKLNAHLQDNSDAVSGNTSSSGSIS